MSAANQLIERIAEASARQISSGYKDIALTRAIINQVVLDLSGEFKKIKWMSDDEGWNNAIEAVQRELQNRYK